MADGMQYERGYAGAGTTVAVLDSGVSANKPELFGDIAPGAYHIFNGVGGGEDAGAPAGCTPPH